MMLGKLAVHYYRPDFTEGQARQLILDYLDDLADFPLHVTEKAIRAYRCDPGSEFFPKLGRLIELAKRAERDAEAPSKPLPALRESRSIRWWSQCKLLWKPHWRESEVPMGEKVRDVPGGPMRDPERVVF